MHFDLVRGKTLNEVTDAYRRLKKDEEVEPFTPTFRLSLRTARIRSKWPSRAEKEHSTKRRLDVPICSSIVRRQLLRSRALGA